MKRSDMIEKMNEVFIKHGSMHKVMDSLLTVCEENGMMPPRRDHLDAQGKPTYSFTWTPEENERTFSNGKTVEDIAKEIINEQYDILKKLKD